MLLHRHGFNYLQNATEKVLTYNQVFYSHHSIQPGSVIEFSWTSIDFLKVLKEFKVHIENILTHLKSEDNVIKQLQNASQGTSGDELNIIMEAELWFMRKFSVLLEYIENAISNFPSRLGYSNLQSDVQKNWNEVKDYWQNFANEKSFIVYIDNAKGIWNTLKEIEKHSYIIASHIKGDMEHFRQRVEFLRKEEEAMDDFSRNVKSWLT